MIYARKPFGVIFPNFCFLAINLLYNVVIFTENFILPADHVEVCHSA